MSSFIDKQLLKVGRRCRNEIQAAATKIVAKNRARVHVYPLGDSLVHATNTHICACNPKNKEIIVHKKFKKWLVIKNGTIIGHFKLLRLAEAFRSSVIGNAEIFKIKYLSASHVR